MSTRQLRISDAQQIREKIDQYVGKKMNFVLRDGTAVVGVLKSASGQEVEILNMAQRNQRFPMSSITEIYIDSLA